MKEVKRYYIMSKHVNETFTYGGHSFASGACYVERKSGLPPSLIKSNREQRRFSALMHSDFVYDTCDNIWHVIKDRTNGNHKNIIPPPKDLFMMVLSAIPLEST